MEMKRLKVFKSCMLLALAFICMDAFSSYLYGEIIEPFRYIFVLILSLLVFSSASYICKSKYEIGKDTVYIKAALPWLNGKEIINLNYSVDIEESGWLVRVKQQGKRDFEFIKAFFDKTELHEFISEIDRLTNRSK